MIKKIIEYFYPEYARSSQDIARLSWEIILKEWKEFDSQKLEDGGMYEIFIPFFYKEAEYKFKISHGTWNAKLKFFLNEGSKERFLIRGQKRVTHYRALVIP